MAQVEFAGHKVIEALPLEQIRGFEPGNNRGLSGDAFPFGRQDRQLANAENGVFFRSVLLEPVDRADTRIGSLRARLQMAGAGPGQRKRDNQNQRSNDRAINSAVQVFAQPNTEQGRRDAERRDQRQKVPERLETGRNET